MTDEQVQKFSPEREYLTPYNVDIKTYSPQIFQIYQNEISKLTEIFKILLIDFSTAEFIEDKLSPQFQLSPDQIKEITRIIRDIILTKISLTDLVKTVEEKLKVDEVRAREITNFIFTNLFSKEAMEELKKLHIAKFGQTVAPKPEVTNNPNIIDLRSKSGE